MPKQDYIGLDIETSSTDVMTCNLAGVGLYWEDPTGSTDTYLPFNHPDSSVDKGLFQDMLKKLIKGKKVCTHSTFDAIILKRILGIDINPWLDSYVMALLLQEEKLGLEDLSVKYLNQSKKNKPEIMNCCMLPVSQVEDYCKQDAKLAYNLSIKLEEVLIDQGMEETIRMEMDVSQILWKNSFKGFGVDLAKHETALTEMNRELGALEDDIFGLITEARGGEMMRFPLNSHKKLAALLYDDLGISPNERFRTKTGYSIKVEAIESIQDQSPVLKPILDWKHKFAARNGLRKLPSKLKNGRLHPEWKQIGYLKGSARIYSTEPSVTQLPKVARKCIIFD